MKPILSLILLFFTFSATAQNVKLKKKWLKTYIGQIPAHEVNLNNQIIQIRSVDIKARLTKDSLLIQVGNLNWSGTYAVTKLEKKKFQITGKMVGSGIPEILKLDLRSKKIIRAGVFPQPDAELTIKKNKN